jgi:thiamine pyrophosphate-dependent acetolactate synthase large subunit-like protein
VTDPDGIETAVREAVATDGPVVLDVAVRDD